MPNAMGDGLRQGRTLLGLCNMYPASGIIECMCHGWDFVWIDGQHGQISYDAALHAVQAADAAGITTLLRVPGHEACILGPWADLAPSAIMVPMVNTAAQARELVNQLRFPPLGTRSYGGRRVIDLYGRNYYKDQELLVVAQIETLEAVKNAADIIGVEGIDVLFFGGDDMKAQMGLPIDTAVAASRELQDALAQTARAAKAAGKFAACVAPNPADLRMAVEMGYQLIVGGGDVAFLRTLAAERLKTLKAELAKPGGKSVSGASGGLYGR